MAFAKLFSNTRIWMDMEGQVRSRSSSRSNSLFDLEKVGQVCEIAFGKSLDRDRPAGGAHRR